MAYTITDDCISCGVCKENCPVDAITEGSPYVIDPDACIDCGACATNCPVDAPIPEQSHNALVKHSESPVAQAAGLFITYCY